MGTIYSASETHKKTKRLRPVVASPEPSFKMISDRHKAYEFFNNFLLSAKNDGLRDPLVRHAFQILSSDTPQNIWKQLTPELSSLLIDPSTNEEDTSTKTELVRILQGAVKYYTDAPQYNNQHEMIKP